ncbi:MAG: hypothetical protein HY540_07920 [Deltaproteobacteria bacterium]|nr:hypothetical protein [Deltaproteobacteria bacterium]
MMPNRLQANWPAIKPKILSRWNELSETELETTAGDFGRVVELIRNRYKQGRSPISVEAKIYDWILQELNEIEHQEIATPLRGSR